MSRDLGIHEKGQLRSTAPSIIFSSLIILWEPQIMLHLWSNDYSRRKWTHQPEFKSWTRLLAFSHRANTLGKGMNPTILPPAMSK